MAIIIGVTAIKYQKNIASGIAEGQRTMFGKVGEKVARQSTLAGRLVAGSGGLTGILVGIL